MEKRTIAPPLAGSVAGAEDFVVAEWTDDGGGFDQPLYIAPHHVHREDDEAWYVLEGTLCVQVDDEIVETRKGSLTVAPKGSVHTYWNPNPEPARYLLFMSPNVHRLIQAIHETEDRSPEKLKALFEAHRSELR